MDGDFWSKFYILQHKHTSASCWTPEDAFPLFIHLLLFNFTCLYKKSVASLVQSNPRPVSLTFSISKASWGLLPGLLSPSGLLPQICCKNVKLGVLLGFTVSFLRANSYNTADVVQIFGQTFRRTVTLSALLFQHQIELGRHNPGLFCPEQCLCAGFVL